MEVKQVNVSVKAFGNKSALSFESDAGRNGDHRISVQGAPCTEPQKYDWSKKVVVQLTEAECLKTLAVLIGALPKFEANQHGSANDKGFSIELQANGKFFAKVFQKSNAMHAVPIEPVDVCKIVGLLLRQLQLNQPWLSCTDIRANVMQVFSAVTAVTQAAAAPSKS